MPPFALVIFGVTGDLSRRKLLPAVYNLFCQTLLPDGFRLVGCGRGDQNDDSFRELVRSSLLEYSAEGAFEEHSWRQFSRSLCYQRLDPADSDSFAGLADRLDDLAGDDESISTANRLFYLATPADSFADFAIGLGRSGLSDPAGGWARIVIEKPFGLSAATCELLNSQLASIFEESQIYRIDHYLGKETVQNLLVFRFANSIFEPIWNHKYIDHVQITVSETVGLESRAAYYEKAGAIRDIVQNHMMQLLALVATEPPSSLAADEIRAEKLQVLKAMRCMTGNDVPNNVVCAQYAAGSCDGKKVPGYLEEPGIPADSVTETFVAIKAFIDNWRWADVPFYLRTGKRLPARVTEIGIHFKPVPRILFNTSEQNPMQPNSLAIRIQPNEGISLQFQVKHPGAAMRIESLNMDFAYSEAFAQPPGDAYERLLLDAIAGDQTLFTHIDEVMAAWGFIDPILRYFGDRTESPLPSYPAGSWGPDQADRLLADDGRKWLLTRRPLGATAVEVL